jgi:hypothetical protein
MVDFVKVVFIIIVLTTCKDGPSYYWPKFTIIKFVSKKGFLNNLNIRFLGTEKNQFFDIMSYDFDKM